jgi:hypothetical protein
MSDTLNDKELTDSIKKQQKDSGMLDKESFWNEFKEKAKGLKQDADVQEPMLYMPQWAKVAACFIIATCLFSSIFMYNRSDSGPEISGVEDYEIYIDHSAVLILQDEDEAGTILWVTGLNENKNGEML